MVERDYVLTHIMHSVAATRGAEQLIFKGGTALRLCFYENYRYSADLDFSVVNVSLEDAHAAIAQALESCQERVGFEVCELTEEDPPRIKYLGTLGRAQTIKLDIATDELVLEQENRSLLIRYEDQPENDETLSVYSLTEVTAEKLRCVIQRHQCRDPFDLHFLLVGEGVNIEDAWASFDRKARHRGIDPQSFEGRLSERESRYGKEWSREIEEHLGTEAPPFEQTMRELRRALRSRG